MFPIHEFNQPVITYEVEDLQLAESTDEESSDTGGQTMELQPQGILISKAGPGYKPRHILREDYIHKSNL